MGLTSALYTGLSGLNASQQRLDVSGNNIANVNTIGFKGSRTTFQTQLSQTLSAGTPPGATSGGTNPVQIGLGTTTGAIQKDMTGGSIETTGINTDVAIQGNGFFVLRDNSGSTVYSRDGSFSRDANQMLVNSNGYRVMGYPVDSNFNIVSGNLSGISIPLGRLSIAEATTNTAFSGNLDAMGTPAQTPGTALSEELINIAGGAPAAGTTALTSLATSSTPGTTLFSVGDIVTLEARKGGRNIDSDTYTVTAGSTVQDLMQWIQTKTGIDTTSPQNPPAGVSIGPDGKITVVGNLGPDNNIEISLSSTGTVPKPISWTSTEGDGSSKFTSFLIYDSLGNPALVDMTFVMVEKTTAGTTWRFYAESSDDSDANPFMGTGTLTFNTSGTLTNATGTDLILNRANTGAIDPISFRADFSKIQGLANGNSNVVMETQNGFGAGTLTDFGVGMDGVIQGYFSNGLSRPLGQLVLATFANPEGLIADGNNLYISGPNSGEPSVTTPGDLGAGFLIGGALELSNVDLTREFISMVTATTAFSAAGKVITTSNQLLNELMSIIR